MTSASGLQLNLDASSLEVSGAGAVVSNQEQKPRMDNKVNESNVQVGNASTTATSNQGGNDDERSNSNVAMANDGSNNGSASTGQVQYGEHSIQYSTMHFPSQHPTAGNASGQVQGNPLFNGGHQHARVLTTAEQDGNANAAPVVYAAQHQPGQNITAQTVIQSQFSSTPPASSLAESNEARYSYFAPQTDRVSPNAAAAAAAAAAGYFDGVRTGSQGQWCNFPLHVSIDYYKSYPRQGFPLPLE
ncbi:uncharacterized protein TRIADDRAFT_62098 [Trichoplax adhaerens]|uniref:Uncharacterized protein n=1 Tax=Trichoplax adhaerens TaxID=10228 RepID=B3SCU2_TRIAD|nr:predicted protein [Trichoplax adhaerens]EDV19447.1 predicted protein [Trichoplax adhaerens]|eukprot:XP_002118047.1 predicted protein [Trichoplax adhaerens]